MTDYWSLIFFNLLYTSVPPIIFGILDKDLSAETLLCHPELYKASQKNEVLLGSEICYCRFDSYVPGHIPCHLGLILRCFPSCFIILWDTEMKERHSTLPKAYSQWNVCDPRRVAIHEIVPWWMSCYLWLSCSLLLLICVSVRMF